jgi:hypothetical protein
MTVRPASVVREATADGGGDRFGFHDGFDAITIAKVGEVAFVD